MGFLIARISGGAIGLVLALFAFIVQVLIRRKKLPALLVRIISGIGAVGGIYLFAATVQNILKYTIGLSSLLTVFAPLLVYGVVLTVHFIVLFTGKPKSRLTASSTLTVSAVVSVQLGLALFNLIRNWNNLSHGMKEFLYIQLIGLFTIILTALLFWLSFFRTKKFIEGSGGIQSRLGTDEEHYAKLGLKKGTVEQWEDGTRTRGGEKGTYEWWYFDSHMDDGTTLVIVFYTKHMMSPGGPPVPHVTISLVTADGRPYAGEYEVSGVPFSASKEGCDVHIGPCYITGNLREYDIYFKNDKAEATVHLKSSVPPWRPGTGHIFFGNKDEHFFAWLPSVPEGTVTATITLDGNTTKHTGTGYHDHNWGNINMRYVLNHWYWGRARIGDYRVITSYIYGEKKYGYREFPIFMIAGENKILADNGGSVTFTASDEFIEEKTAKPVHNALIYDYDDGKRHYRVSYTRKNSIVHFKMIEELKGVIKFLAALAGFDGAYHRFTGDAIVERLEGGRVVEKLESPAIWELMYFGHIPKK
jgi:hypothetical protein